MNFKSQATLLFNFLNQTKKIWEDEVLDSYPQSLNNYRSEWIDTLWNLTISDLHDFDSHREVEAIKNSDLEIFIREMRQITKVLPTQDSNEIQLEDWAFIDVKAKKKHEIQKIAPLLTQIKKDCQFDKIIDIGGGVGHLSRILAHYYGIDSVSVDMNLEFQKIGQKRMSKYRKLSNAASLKFLNINFGDPADEIKLAHEMNSKSFTLGLHTCGNLANHLIFNTQKFNAKGLLSFGCCYQKLNAKEDFPISKFYKENFPLELNVYSRTLASRAHSAIDFSEFDSKHRVKNYRHALHLFLYYKLNIKDCFNVGEMHVREYYKPFEEYLNLKLNELGISHSYSLKDFKDFYHNPEIIIILKKMFLSNLIRWQLGRTLEVFILLDRAIYLEENNYTVTMQEYFSDSISPRNIGILAVKKCFEEDRV